MYNVQWGIINVFLGHLNSISHTRRHVSMISYHRAYPNELYYILYLSWQLLLWHFLRLMMTMSNLWPLCYLKSKAFSLSVENLLSSCIFNDQGLINFLCRGFIITELEGFVFQSNFGCQRYKSIHGIAIEDIWNDPNRTKYVLVVTKTHVILPEIMNCIR